MFLKYCSTLTSNLLLLNCSHTFILQSTHTYSHMHAPTCVSMNISHMHTNTHIWRGWVRRGRHSTADKYNLFYKSVAEPLCSEQLIQSPASWVGGSCTAKCHKANITFTKMQLVLICSIICNYMQFKLEWKLLEQPRSTELLIKWMTVLRI